MSRIKVLGLITARGGSKEIPRKNIVPVAGKPLIAWTIEAAQRSSRIDRLILSTDDEEIAATARQCGVEAPFMRPASLATDDSGTLGVALHAIDWATRDAGGEPEYVLILQPTSPLRTSADIDGAIALAYERGAEAVLGVSPATLHPYETRHLSTASVLHPFIELAEEPVRRQDYPPAFFVNGALYLATPKCLRDRGTFEPPGALGYLMPVERSLDIDTRWQLRLAELFLSDEYH